MTLASVRRLPRGMRDRLMLSAATLIGAIALFVAAFFPWRLERQALRSAETKATAVQAIVAHGLLAPLVFHDTSAVAEVVAAAMLDPEVTIVQVTDAEGGVVLRVARDSLVEDAARFFDTTAAGRSHDSELAVTEAEVRQDGTLAGRVRLGFSLATLHADVASARRTGLLFGSLILVLGIGLAYATANLVTRPLRDLSETVAGIANGEFGLRARSTGVEEVAELVCAFNRMVDTVVHAQQELSAANADLEQRVEERTRTLRTFIDLIPQPLISVDHEWRVTRWNRAAEQLFGWTSEELLGQPLPYATGAAASNVAYVRSELEAGRAVPPMEAVRMRRDGTPVDVLLSAAPLSNGEDRNIGYVAALTDLTERKSLEGQLRQSQKMEAVGRLAGGIAHDFNNILTVITVTCNLLLEAELPDDVRADVEQVSGAALRAAALTRQLLAFTRSDLCTYADVQVTGVLENLLPMLRRLMRENIRVETALHSAYLIHADPVQIEQVIMNLVVNAGDAMPSGGIIRVEVADVTLDERYVKEHVGVEPGEYVRLTVADSGIGMSPEVMARIFEPFFTTKPLGKGTGLGLATTYAIINRLRGRIDVRSTPGAGTVFDLYIPRSQAVPPSRAEPARAADGSDGHETVLIVEDENAVRLVLRRSLERLGYSVREASSAEAAIESLRADPRVDVVVSDIMMPGMNGRQLADWLTVAMPGLPVLLMTGYADETANPGGFSECAAPVVLKPVTERLLAREIRALLATPFVAAT